MSERRLPWTPVAVDRSDIHAQTRYRSPVTLAIAAFYDDHDRLLIIEDGYEGRILAVGTIIDDSPQEFRFRSADRDELIVVRPVRADDAATAMPLHIPLPPEIIGGIMAGTTPQPTLSAAVDDQGDVHTMVLETATGLYARFSRNWLLLSDITPIEQLQMVAVDPEDLEHYDMADDSGKTISIRDLTPTNEPSISATGPSRTASPPAVPVTAGAAPLITVASAADLPDAIAYAATQEGAGSRWYVARRAKALGHTDPLPWEVTS